ncbi:MAG: type 4a pilus biogenesis protein PilO [Pseudomonadota bacterium]|nr:type 4a pilus biogenesis protein PilO [Pseudomonadota bacterium]MDO7710403.1 type 4a pilus biogenesis protein PilO [Pseudomonadota bacterium]
MDSFIRNTEPRIIAILLASILIMTLLASYLYVFKNPIKSLKSNQQTLKLLSAEVEREIPLGKQIEDLEQQAYKIKRLVNASGQQLPQNQMIAYVIGQLDLIAVQHKVQLTSVMPGMATKIFMFEELPFNIEMKGSYFDLYNFLKDVDVELAPIVIKSFSLIADGETTNRRMNAVIVSYLSEKGEL